MTREQQYWEDTQEALSRVFDRCEEIDPQSGYDMLEDIQFIRGFINKHKPRTEEQEPRKGHWILKRTFPTKLHDEYLNEYKCSECYREIRCTESQLVNYPYCHCGADMKGEKT